MRLDKFLCNLKYGSRKEIKDLCKKKQVKVNDKIITDSSFMLDLSKDCVYVDDKKVFYKENITIMINKPQGYICSNVDEAYPSLLNLLPEHFRRFDFNFAGRLDVDTEGLVIISTDGNLIHSIISPKKEIKKVYYLKTKVKIKNLDTLLAGVNILDGKNEVYFTKAEEVLLLSENEMLLTISEGKFHQVKRMIEAISNEVIFLKRIQIGRLKLPETLKLGDFVEIDPLMIF